MNQKAMIKTKTIYIFAVLMPLFAILPWQSFAEEPEAEEPEVENHRAITVGLLKGGGSLLGIDFEFMASDHIGIQFGFGYVGLGAGLNYHIEPTVESSFISLQLMNQGTFDENLVLRAVSGNYVFRRGIFQAQLGLGFPIEYGPLFPEEQEQSPIILTYAIGLTFPW